MVIYHEYKKTTPLLFLQIHFSKMKTLSMCNFNILRHYQATTVKQSGAFCTGTAEQEVDPHLLLVPIKILLLSICAHDFVQQIPGYSCL